MGRSRVQEKILIVEGSTEQRLIPELIESNGIRWELDDRTRIVHIEKLGGLENLTPEFIDTQLQASGLKNLGIIIDADDQPEQRWQSIRNRCNRCKCDLPSDLPKEGLVQHLERGIRFGIWMMPDNTKQGMLETFLTYLIPDREEPIWKFAQKSATHAHESGAPFKVSHRDKANIHTWLAWQNPPGEQLHGAVQRKIFEGKHPRAQIFVRWFRDLYEL
jgi:hypothetical protein